MKIFYNNLSYLSDYEFKHFKNDHYFRKQRETIPEQLTINSETVYMMCKSKQNKHKMKLHKLIQKMYPNKTKEPYGLRKQPRINYNEDDDNYGEIIQNPFDKEVEAGIPEIQQNSMKQNSNQQEKHDSEDSYLENIEPDWNNNEDECIIEEENYDLEDRIYVKELL